MQNLVFFFGYASDFEKKKKKYLTYLLILLYLKEKLT